MHVRAAERVAHLRSLSPGDDIDYRGTTFTAALLREVLAAVFDAGMGRPRVGAARFDGASFVGAAGFRGVVFGAVASFDRAMFGAGASFRDARFGGRTGFARAEFRDVAFEYARFAADAVFDNARFLGKAAFLGSTFGGDARFGTARFEAASRLGPMVCQGRLDLSGAYFAVPVTIDVAAREVACIHTEWFATTTLRVRRAAVDLTDAVVTQPIAVTAHPELFETATGLVLTEGALTGRTRVTSLRGVDAAFLVLTDTDLSGCVFAGAFHLDQLRLAGRIRFAEPPTGVHRRGPLPLYFTRRRTLVEEHHWRASRTPPAVANAPTAREWRPGPVHTDPDAIPGPDDLAPLYRALRKAFEDGKNEPGAAHFYYGEMEMRRHDHHDTSRAERGLLAVYWAVSGYGLRASRAMIWLGILMAATIAAMMLWGLPTTDPKPLTTGVQAAPGGPVRLITDNPDATVTGPLRARLTGKRADKAVRVVLNSVVFRSSGQGLTREGTYIEMGSRLVEPVLLALAVLAVRGRIKR